MTSSNGIQVQRTLMYHQTPTPNQIDKHGLQRVLNYVNLHGYGCRICDAEVSIEHPRDATGCFWLSAVPKAQRRHNRTYHPCIDERERGHFSESVPWHDNAPWTSYVNRHGTHPKGQYCKLKACRYATMHMWPSPILWRRHLWTEHGYHALAQP